MSSEIISFSTGPLVKLNMVLTAARGVISSGGLLSRNVSVIAATSALATATMRPRHPSRLQPTELAAERYCDQRGTTSDTRIACRMCDKAINSQPAMLCMPRLHQKEKSLPIAALKDLSIRRTHAEQEDSVQIDPKRRQGQQPVPRTSCSSAALIIPMYHVPEADTPNAELILIWSNNRNADADSG